MLEVCEKEDDYLKIECSKLKMIDGVDKSAFLDNVAGMIWFLPKQVQQVSFSKIEG